MTVAISKDPAVTAALAHLDGVGLLNNQSVGALIPALAGMPEVQRALSAVSAANQAQSRAIREFRKALEAATGAGPDPAHPLANAVREAITQPSAEKYGIDLAGIHFHRDAIVVPFSVPWGDVGAAQRYVEQLAASLGKTLNGIPVFGRQLNNLEAKKD